MLPLLAPAVVIAALSSSASVTMPTVNGGEQEQIKASIPTAVCLAVKKHRGICAKKYFLMKLLYFTYLCCELLW